jgi:hypothetical protein
MSIRRVRSRTTAVAILCVGSLLVAGCGESGPGAATGPAAPASADPGPVSHGELEEQADLGGVLPGSTAAGAELLESAVTNTDELIDHLGGHWTFLDGGQAYDPELVRGSSNPQTCSIRDPGGGLVRGGQYHVVALTERSGSGCGRTAARTRPWTRCLPRSMGPSRGGTPEHRGRAPVVRWGIRQESMP